MMLDTASEAAKSTNPYIVFNRQNWAELRANTPLPISERDLDELRGVNEQISLNDVTDVYLPLSRLLNLLFMADRSLSRVVESAFFGRPNTSTPYIICIAGSVAVGKSTCARLLQALLSSWPDHPRVDLVATDGFLYPMQTLEHLGLMRRKGFPESYDLKRMLTFLKSVKAGDANLRVPLYSHLLYDIVPDSFQAVDRPDILIFEGLNVLQTASQATTIASDFFDFSIYLDAEPSTIEEWYVKRFLFLQGTAFQQTSSYFQNYSKLTKEQAEEISRGIWQETNLVNLVQNIMPTRERAQLIIRKGKTHAVEELWLRRF